MTREEFMEKYGHIEVIFSQYNKYVFTFESELPDKSLIVVECGGHANDIYRFEVASDMADTVRNLKPFYGGIYKNCQKIEGFYKD